MINYSSHKPESCQSCPLLQSPGPCWGSGSSQEAKIIYIAQNPGKEEVATIPMQPLTGPSGQILNRQLTLAGVRRAELFITNQVKCLTPNNRPPTGKEIDCCRPLLQKELDACRSDTVVLAGDVAFKENIGRYSTLSSSYRPEGGLFQRMGCVERRNGRKWIGTIHPAAFFRALPPELQSAPVDHLKKAWIISGIKLQEIKINEHPSDHDVLELVDHILLSSREFSDDVETVGLEDVEEDDYIGSDFMVTMCGIGGRPYEALILDPKQIPLLSPIFDDPLVERYEHNGSYDDYHIMKAMGYEDYQLWLEHSKARRFDTMLGTHYLRSHMPKKLKPFVLSQYTLLPYYQGAGSKKDNLGKVNMRLYNGMDILTTFLAAKEQKRQMKTWQIYNLFMEFGMPMLPILEEWRRIGVKVDLKHALICKRFFTQRIEQAKVNLQKLCGPLFEPTNYNQLKQILYEKHKLPLQYKDKGKVTQRITGDFEARKNLRKWIEAGRMEEYRHAYLILQLIDFAAGEKKKLEYLSRISPDGRLHSYYKAHGTMVFRESSSPNLQNFPVYGIADWGGARRDDSDEDNIPVDEEKGSGDMGSLRSMVIPDSPEDWILTCDFEQLQIWIYMKVAGVKWLEEIFESREYIYGVVYEELYKEAFFETGMPRTKKYKLASVPEQRIRRAKAVPLGFLFGRSAGAVATEYQWTMNEAEKLRNWWFEKCPELLKSYAGTNYELKQQGWIRHKFGQVIHYPGQKLTTAINNKAQSNEAFVVKGAIIKIDRELSRRGLKRRGNRIMLSVHDSISLNVKLADAEEIYEDIVAPIMNLPIPQLDNLALRHSAEMSKSWDWNVINYHKWKEQYGSHSHNRTRESSTEIGPARTL